MKIWKEFKEFAFKGNAMDLAVGVMIGGAFSTIVQSIVNDLFTPLFNAIVGKVNLAAFSLRLGKGANAPVIAYGSFLQAVVNFLLVSLCIFLFVRFVNKLRLFRSEEQPQKIPARLCPYCYCEIHEKATRCPHCTAKLKE